ncbi:hypothetical protein AYJ57_21285 (plasmid) [Salipiger sp. CCB-MM3]|uniref:hypothetical protein n=1 Tax=Salipiger sp. CCB-MM3 TaxID=1792508 RepID=UPI00080ABF7F|nr:hypothetical protein [Salipiger sp. CCB-MM3]ANT63011.1 hypothetical protein AYJ57_21285 [Salipiger sp. CCB-MM3]
MIMTGLITKVQKVEPDTLAACHAPDLAPNYSHCVEVWWAEGDEATESDREEALAFANEMRGPTSDVDGKTILRSFENGTNGAAVLPLKEWENMTLTIVFFNM